MEPKQTRQMLPPHPLPADAQQYLADSSPEERALVQLAMERLQSSYFMEKSHGYRQWKAKQSGASKKK